MPVSWLPCAVADICIVMLAVCLIGWQHIRDAFPRISIDIRNLAFDLC
jgi:hypothetical protein